METNEKIDKILEVIKANPSSNAKAVAEASEIPALQLGKILKKMLSDGLLASEDGEDGKPVYSIGKPGTKPKKVAQPPVVKEDDEAILPKTSGRNNDKFRFNGEEYGKGKLVHAVLSAYISKNKNISLTKLKEVFPDALISARYGVVRELSEARKISGNRDRYFMKPDQILKAGGKSLAVTNQVTGEVLKGFIKAAKALGFTIK